MSGISDKFLLRRICLFDRPQGPARHIITGAAGQHDDKPIDDQKGDFQTILSALHDPSLNMGIILISITSIIEVVHSMIGKDDVDRNTENCDQKQNSQRIKKGQPDSGTREGVTPEA